MFTIHKKTTQRDSKASVKKEVFSWDGGQKTYILDKQ